MRLPALAFMISLVPGQLAAQAAAEFEDYRTPAGRIVEGTLHVALTADVAPWRPWGAGGPAIEANVFRADGAAPRVPAPLIRVTAGTPVHVSLRNALPDTLVVRGLRNRSATRPGGPPFGGLLPDAVTVAPGDSADIRFTPTVPGTYFWFGSRLQLGAARAPFTVARGPFEGVLIVDPVDEAPDPDERIMLITHWADRELPGSWLPTVRFMINGRAWPHTERFEFEQGDSVRWRVINATGINHPMHLHGFHFEVRARGDSWREDVFAPHERRLSVTENLLPAESVRLAFVASEPGNWVFHCHLMRHMSWVQNAALEHEPDMHHREDDGSDPLGGLVIGFTVRPGSRVAAQPPAARRLSLHVGRRERVFGDAAGYGFVLQQGERAPAPDSVHFPGSTIVLTRGEPTEIRVHNRTDAALGVHWHGLELESRSDGVPGWSGDVGAPVPAVAPGDSFTVRITPPRAGTFMYHVHSEPGHQLAQGLYGAFLVMEPGQQWDADTDRLFLLGSLGASLDAPPALNGATAPAPLELRAGTTYRLRFMHISPDDEKLVSLLDDDTVLSWRRIAKDGADLPPSLVGEVPASLRIDVGETYDFEWTPQRAGEFTLRILTTFPPGPPGFVREGTPPPHTMNVPVHVR